VFIMRLVFAACLLATGLAAADPIVIAHRGASGYLPEHTLPAYAFAYAQGAHFIEPDLVMTRDKHLICLHDIHLDATTDVEEKFPHRKRPDGRWYAADFLLHEIKQLEVHERTDNRFPIGPTGFRVPTFIEMLEMIQGLNDTTGGDTGIYPELKAPAFHAREGLPMEQALLDILTRYGYSGPTAKVFVQCFEFEPLEKLRALGATVPLVFLVGGGRQGAERLSPKGLDELARVVNGIGPAKDLIERNPAIVEWAHERGLVVHPYTLRSDDFPDGRYASFEEEVRKFYEIYQVDGTFTDFPDTVLRILRTPAQETP
jgi:glycerophosphoryl diester phosphodiesterase